MKKIMLAIDGSPVAENAAKFIAQLPLDQEVEVTVVSALTVPEAVKKYLAGESYQICMDQERESLDDSFERIQALFSGTGVSLHQVVREGDPAETIVSIAKEIKPELLVIGATGHSAITRILLGSTSDYVATHAPCSVLVVRPSDHPEQSYRLRVAIGYDENRPAEAALEEFSQFGWAETADVRVVSITYRYGLYGLPYNSSSREFVDKAAEQLRKVAPHVVGELIYSDHIGEGLVRYVQSKDIELVVLGETPRSRLGRVLMGSITRFVLRHAPCSVWIARNRTLEAPHHTATQSETAMT